MWPIDDDWYNRYNRDFQNRRWGNRPPTFFDDLMDVANRVIKEPHILDRVKAKRSLTVRVKRGNRHYKVIVEDVTDDENPPVHMEIEDDEGNPVEFSDKHPDWTE